MKLFGEQWRVLAACCLWRASQMKAQDPLEILFITSASKSVNDGVTLTVERMNRSASALVAIGHAVVARL